MKALVKGLIFVILVFCPSMLLAQSELKAVQLELAVLKKKLPEMTSAETSLQQRQAYVQRLLELREKIISLVQEAQQETESVEPVMDQSTFVYVLTDIKAAEIDWQDSERSGKIEHQKNQLGYLYRSKDAISEKVDFVRCTDCPTQITLGETVHFKLETRTRYDSEKYLCRKEAKSQWPPTASFTLVDSFEEFRAIAQVPLTFPSCQDLGVKERLVVPEKNSRHVPYTMIDPVGLTLDESTSLHVDLRFAEKNSRDKGREQVFSYTASYSTNGSLFQEDKEGTITVEYEDSAPPRKLSELPGDNNIEVQIGDLYLTYRLQKNNQPDPLNAVVMATPAEFAKPHLVNQPVAAETPPEKKQAPKGEKPVPEVVANEVDLPDVLGKTYKEAVTLIEVVGLVALPPELGSSAPNPSFVGRVELAVPAVDGPLRRGDKIGLRVFGKASVGFPVPDVVGLGIREAANAIEEAGFVAELELGGNTTDPQKAQTISSQTPTAGVEIERGKSVKLIVLTLQEKNCSVPELGGMPISKANDVLKNLGLTMVPILGGEAAKSEAEVGQVYQQTPGPGLTVKEGAEINVWVYKARPVAVTVPTEQKETSGLGKTRSLPDYTTGSCPSAGTGMVFFDYKSFFIGGKARCVYGEECDSNGRNCFSESGLTAWYDRDIKVYKEPIEDDRFAKGGEWVIFSATKRAYVTFDTGGTRTPKTRKTETFWKNLAKELLRQIEPHAAPRTFAGGGQKKISTSDAYLHICKDPTVQDDSYALKYARGYGGGETTYFIRQNHFCHKKGYSKVVGNKVDYYECRDSDFKDCSFTSSTSAERKEIGDGAYQLIFDGGKSWWTIRPR